MKKIGLLGLTFSDPNKGCMALAYSFYNILKKIYPNEKINITVFSDHDYSIENVDNNLNLFVYKIKKINGLIKLNNEIKKCDIFFDFTEGDSFSDIYGLKRMIKYSLVKLMVVNNKKELVLCPQTYGPFNIKVSKLIAKKIIKKAKYVCTRDVSSTEYIKKEMNIDVDTYTDVAFMLPYEVKKELPISTKKKVGINVSALLCNGGYDTNNQFNLKTDFLDYLKIIIDYLLKSGKYDIYLIPHVYSDEMSNIENDYLWCEKIKKLYPECIVVDKFFSPCEIKGIISQMDIFIGARMHSTIGAFSTLVPVIPFSYSRKFEGLYKSLNYDYVIKAREWEMEKSISMTKKFLSELDEMKEKEKKEMKNIRRINQLFEEKIKELLEDNND